MTSLAISSTPPIVATAIGEAGKIAINPNIENITSQLYPISRPLFIYAKREHLNYAYKMNDFILEIIGNEHLGINGDLTAKGLIPLQNHELRIIRESIEKQIDYKK